MYTSTYRVSDPISVIRQYSVKPTVSELPPGALVSVLDAKPNHEGMIAATHEGEPIVLFQRDLDELAEPIDVRVGRPV